MAVYKGREVSIVGRADGADISPLYTIQHRDGNQEQVKLSTLQFTEEEVNDMKKQNVSHLEHAPVIKNDELQKLRDSQDKAKIEKEQGKQPTEPVIVKNVLVDPKEVQEKTPATKVVK